MDKEKNSKNPTVQVAKIDQLDFFEKLGNKGIFLTLLIIAIVTFLVFKDYIMLKKIYLFKDIGSDTLNGVWPSYYHMDYYFNNFGLPTWSFNEGMGQNIVGTVMRDPFAVLAFLAGPKAMPKIFIFIEVTKILVSGIVFYAFLKQLKVTNFSALVGCLLFSFSGFMIMGSCWYVFTYEAFTLAFLFLGFELYFQKKNWMVFVLSIFFIAAAMPFNLYVSTIILLCYIIFRLGQTEQFNLKNLLQLSFKLVGLAIIGVLLSAPFLETVLQLIESPRGSGGNSYFEILSSKPIFGLIDKFQFGTFITRLFSSDYIGSGSDFRGWQNFLEAPLSYCGILSIILMPQIFSLVNKSTRKWYIIWLVIWLVPTLFPFFRYAFWLFTGDYYRAFSFCVSFVFIIYSVLALDLILKGKKINIITLVITIVASVLLLSYNYFKGTQASVDGTIALFVKVAMVVYAGLLFFMNKPNANPNLKYALLIFLCFELAFLSSYTVNRRPAVLTTELNQKINYNDYSVEAVDYIKKKETGFYRIDKNYYSSGAIHGSLNDHKILNYYSTSSYNSFANTNFINYLREYGVISKVNEYESRWVSGLIRRPILESLNNVKYILTKDANKNPVWQSTHDSVDKFNDVLVLQSKFSLPFGYTYDTYLKQNDFDKLSSNQKDFVSLQACIVNSEDESKIAGLKTFNLADTNKVFTFDSYRAHIDSLKINALKLTEFEQTKIGGKVIVDKPKIMYLSFAFDKGWHLKLDGADAKPIILNYGMTGIYLPKGEHTIEMNYKPRLLLKGVYLIFLGLLMIGILVLLDKKKRNFFNYIPSIDLKGAKQK